MIDFRDRNAPSYRPYTEEEQARYDAYIWWRSTTHNGRLRRADLSPEKQAEWDRLGITEGSFWSDIDPEEARRLYEEVTGTTGK